MFQTLKWLGDIDGVLEIIDQRRLPAEFVRLRCTNIEMVYEAIKTLAIRGAPAIGVAAAYGVVLAMQKAASKGDMDSGLSSLTEACKYLASSRPTAVNLFRALDRVSRRAKDFIAVHPQADLKSLRRCILTEAESICTEDIEMCRRIGENGWKFIKESAGVLTHCNAGALATAGQGTALSLIFEAKKKGRRFKVYADETRPLLQGARLTAWELKQAGVDVTVICDNTAGWLMKQGKIDLVITGADRIAANGDAANKIGTYSLAVLAGEHNIPFYIAAPSSTFDLDIENGEQIPIEERAGEELSSFGGRRVVPEGVKVYNPAFDVTDASLITAIITEKGVIEKPDTGNIREHLGSYAYD